MSNWTLDWQSGSLYAITNRTGDKALDVHLSAHGPMISGRIGQRDWSANLDEIPAGDCVEQVFKAAWGARADPPYVRVEWIDSKGREWVQELEIPHN